jgi:hypothetical protein
MAEKILVVANETVGGQAVIDAVRRHAEKGEVEVTVVCPQNQPKHGYVVYDEGVRAAAENRLKTTIAQLQEVGIKADGELLDPDPYAATMDAVSIYSPDVIIISTHPETRSGWMRRDLVSRVEADTGLPVEHVVVDLDRDREQARHVLVVANQTVGGGPLLDLLKKKAQSGPHTFTVILPQSEEAAGSEAHERLAHTLHVLEEAGLKAVGQVMHPDPYTSIQNALQFYNVDEIVISTFPDEKSGWMRSNLIERVEAATSKPVEHVVVSESEAKEGATA